MSLTSFLLYNSYIIDLFTIYIAQIDDFAAILRNLGIVHAL